MTKRPAAPQTQAVAEAERAFRALLQATSLSEDLQRDHVDLSRSYGTNNAFLGWNDSEFRAATKALRKSSPRVSETTIGRALVDSIIRLFETHVLQEDADSPAEVLLDTILPSLPSAAIAQEVSSILQYLDTRVASYDLFVPLQGIELRSPSIRIVDFTVHAHDQGPLPPLLKEKAQQEHWRQIVEYAQQDLASAGSYVVVAAEGDDTVAEAHALRRAQDIVDIVNLYAASALDRGRSLQKIAVAGQIGILGEQVVLFARTPVAPDGTVALGYKGRKPPLFKHIISEETVQEWQGPALDQVVGCFEYEGSDPKVIESRLRRSVRWHSKGITADGTEEQFVALATSLESLLVGSEGTDPKVNWGSITQRLAERVAFLLGRTYEDRVAFERNAKTLYGLRSKVVHEGKAVSRANLAAMDSLARSTILAFARKAFGSWDDFLHWERNEKYGH